MSVWYRRYHDDLMEVISLGSWCSRSDDTLMLQLALGGNDLARQPASGFKVNLWRGKVYSRSRGFNLEVAPRRSS